MKYVLRLILSNLSILIEEAYLIFNYAQRDAGQDPLPLYKGSTKPYRDPRKGPGPEERPQILAGPPPPKYPHLRFKKHSGTEVSKRETSVLDAHDDDEA